MSLFRAFADLFDRLARLAPLDMEGALLLAMPVLLVLVGALVLLARS